MPSVRLAVIGAGAVGLSTAVQLKQEFPTAEVTVIADRFGPDTTSDGAAGIFRPYTSKVPGVPIEVFKQWLRDSWQHYHSLAHSEDAGEAGCKVVTGLELYNAPPDTSLTEAILYSHQECTKKELDMYSGPKFKCGYSFKSIMTECRRYLPYLTKRFQALGGIIVQKKVTDLSEFVGMFDCIVLCVGFEAKNLLRDDQMYAVRGQLLRVSAPWLKECVYAEDDNKTCTYVYPGQDNVVIGGTRQKHDEDISPREEDQLDIWSRACQIVPSLKKATLLWSWAGIRPTRSPLRLERETMHFPTGQIKVVHNYGHGGEGVSLSWGTSKAAVQLVRDVLQEEGKVSSVSSKL